MNPSSVLNDRLRVALQHLATSTPRLIAAPATSSSAGGARGRRASVAIIIRIRPNDSVPSSPSSTGSPARSLYTPSASRPTSPPRADDSFSAAPSPAAPPLPLPMVGRTETPPVDPHRNSTLPSEPPRPPSDTEAKQRVKSTLAEFFDQPWARNGTPELLYIKRAARVNDRWSAHVAFPGGRQEPEDESTLYTAMRETFEEVGIDLAENEFLCIGQLDDREITTSLGKRLLMILSPFVFLYTGKTMPIPDLQPTEVASAHWVPLSMLHSPQARFGNVHIDLGSRLAPKSKTIRAILQLLIGHMTFRCILLPNEPCAVGVPSPEDSRGGRRPDLRCWGLTLGMSLDLLSLMDDAGGMLHPSPATYPLFIPPQKKSIEVAHTPTGSVPTTRQHSRSSSTIFSTEPPPASAPSMASVFPRFSHPDVNLLLYIFGSRYRRLLKRWDQRAPLDAMDRRANWAGMALGSFYSALRRALLVAIVLRAAVALAAIGALSTFLARRWRRARRLASSV